MKYNYIIIEDEKSAFENLQTAIKTKKQYIFKGFATNVKDGLSLVLEQYPDLIFLDVELGNESGFDLIQELKNAFYDLPPIIMTTGHDHYAKAAVNNQVAYFLSKLIDEIELAKALQIFEKKFANKSTQIFIRDAKKLKPIQYKDILYLEANSSYTDIYLTNGIKKTSAKTLKHFESKLNQDFLRVHRSFIINTTKIKSIQLTDRKISLQGINDFSEEIIIGKDFRKIVRNQLRV